MKHTTITKVIGISLSAALLASVATGCGSASNGDTVQIINVSYDPTRELYTAYNELFAKHWKEKTGQDVEVTQSHGGSGKQALEVANGLEADVVTLALEYDVDAIQDAGLIDDGWISEFDDDSAPYTSTIVFLVRKGNPKNIQDWDDLVKDGVGVITPNPKTSGGARWNYLAAWAYATQEYGDDEAKTEDYMKKLYQNVLVLDSGARGATTTFVENGQGDVLLACISILAQPSVAVVDDVVDRKGTREVATEYLSYLYSDEAQRIAGDNYYRPSNPDILKEYADVFDLNVNLVTIQDFGGWEEAQKTHFADGGIFDKIYEK